MHSYFTLHQLEVIKLMWISLGCLNHWIGYTEADYSQRSILASVNQVRVFERWIITIFFPPGGPISVELAVQILHSALCVEVKEPPSSAHWMLLCSPFPLLYVLAQHLNQAFRSAVTMLLYWVMLLSHSQPWYTTYTDFLFPFCKVFDFIYLSWFSYCSPTEFPFLFDCFSLLNYLN